MKTTAITVGSTVKVVNAGPYRFMTGTVAGVMTDGTAFVALIEAAGNTLHVRLSALEVV